MELEANPTVVNDQDKAKNTTLTKNHELPFFVVLRPVNR